ncbi:MAG TPA: hypothetical protein ENH33_00660 [Actinobacteria bacterium]|nr:hypothetical protein [Actinomycetota bacterium]
MTILAETIGTILDNYADVIEGGNAHRGAGSVYKGIPGTRTWDNWAKDNGAGLVVDAGVSSTTAIELTGVPAANAAELVREKAPPFYVVATTAASAGVTGAARKISAHDGAVTFTTAAFPGVVVADDVVAIAEGFKRTPDHFDPEADTEEESPGDFDRFFRLTMGAGQRRAWHGNGTAMYQTTLFVDLRLLRRTRQHEDEAAALENANRIADVVCRGEHRGDNTMLVTQEGVSILKQDQNKTVSRIALNLIYQLNTSYL